MKRCYYEILDIEKKATPGQVKTAYRKMAIKYHPDKNPTEEGKKTFMEVQQAYEILSDANERTFYDNNREKILFNKDDMSKEDLQEYTFGFNIWEYFTTKCFKGFGDDEGSFFSVYRNVFEKIKGQELKAFKSRDDLEQQMRKYEGFGSPTTNVEKVLTFYEDWQNFTTYKTFVWSEEYDTRDAQNRWVKRRMQEENKKQRIKQKKNYIKTIKDLVSFVKKRDMRFQQHLIHLKQEQERKLKQKLKKQEEKKKDKQQMKKIKQKLQEERFREIEEYYKQNNAPQQKTEHFYEEDDAPEFFCAICDKTFKSQNQLDNHEKSKIHKQNVKLLQKEVMLPGQKIEQALKEDDQATNENTVTEPAKKKRNRRKKNKNNQPGNEQDDKDEEQVETPQKPQPAKQTPNQNQAKNNNKTKKQESQSSEQQVKQQTKGKNKNNAGKNQNNEKKEQQKPIQPKKKVQSQNDQSSDDDDILMSLAQNQNKKNADHSDDDDKHKNKKGGKKAKQEKKNNKPLDSESDEQGEGEEKKLGKAKLKKMKKAEQQKDNNGMKCKSCSLTFPSKTKLFDHLKLTGHAAYKS